jgi:hypothetical protein
MWLVSVHSPPSDVTSFREEEVVGEADGRRVRARMKGRGSGNLKPAVAVLSVLASVLVLGVGFTAGWWVAALNWTRDARNAGVVQTLAAVAQVIFAAVLATLTWQATTKARAVATDAADRARVAAHPHVDLRNPRFPSGSTGPIRLTMTNVGLGPALHVAVHVSDHVLPYIVKRPRGSFSLRPDEMYTVVLGRDPNVRTVPARQRVSPSGGVHLCTVQVRYFDVHETLVHLAAKIDLDSVGADLRLSHSHHHVTAPLQPR